ncbi:N-acetylmuramoyl-L-alanine amidase [Tomitella biformata]|uniref:N-acetylmuramoyl-L-alanine amidase n=1 Tax=Tomitella biformata TaxID=630403 RepID=UPI0004631913|nr:N-acetylmuramoyl-L-alanine amidase [Tomitella biformata]
MRVTPSSLVPRRSAVVAIAAAVGLALTGCTIPASSDSSAAASSAPGDPADSPTASPTPTPTAEQPLIGKTVYLDPGHGGPIGDEMWQMVPDGHGGTVQCQTEGAITNAGLREESFTLQTSQLLAADLKRLGAEVIVSRGDDSGGGACVDQRIEAANQAGADAFISLHADAGPEFSYGFYIDYPTAVTGDPVEQQSADLALSIRDAMVAVELIPSTYAGEEGLQANGTMAELGLARVPAVVVQMANMGNGIEGALLADPSVRKGYSKSLSAGIVDFLTGLAAPTG